MKKKLSFAMVSVLALALLLVVQPAVAFASDMGAGVQSVMNSSNFQPVPPAQVTPASPTDVTLEQGLRQRCSTVYYSDVRKLICSAVFPNITPPSPPPTPSPPSHDCPWTESNPKCWGV